MAYACDPERGSEFGVGWGWLTHIAERHDVVALTADFNRPAIERYFSSNAANRIGSLEFVYVPNRRWQYKPEGFWLTVESSALKPLMNLAYQHWLGDARVVARRLVDTGRFDLIHLLTYVSFRFPGKFWNLGLPFVWGPVGGLENTPWRLLPLMGLGGGLFYACRNVVNTIQLRMLPGPKKAFAAAGGNVIAATSGIREAIWRHYRVPSTVVCEIGPPEIPEGEPAIRELAAPMRIAWSGMHTPGKALPLLLHALAAVPPAVHWRLEILGDGPCRAAWFALARRLNLQDRCQWSGWLPRADAIERIRSSHVFVITSLKDLTSNVALEALSLGVPVICPAHCGFTDLVSDDCGIQVPIGSEHEIVSGIAGAVVRLWSDETERRRLSKGALARCREYSWQTKMNALDRVYSSAARESIMQAR